MLVQLANHPLLIRRLYTDETVKRLAKKFHPLGVFGYECNLERVEEELSSYSDFSIHEVSISVQPALSFRNVPVYRSLIEASLAN